MRDDFSNPDIRFYKEGDILLSEDGVPMEFNPYKGTREQLQQELMNGIIDSFKYPVSPYFRERASKIFNPEEYEDLLSQISEVSQFGGSPFYSEDIKGLEDIYTPESLKAYQKEVLGLILTVLLENYLLNDE